MLSQKSVINLKLKTEGLTDFIVLICKVLALEHLEKIKENHNITYIIGKQR